MLDPKNSNSSFRNGRHVGGPFEAYIERILESRSPERAQEGAVARSVAYAAVSAGLSNGRPNLGRIAAHVGVKDVRIVPLAMDGRVIAEGGSLVIEVSSNLAPFQRRFTLAHELTHVILRSYAKHESGSDSNGKPLSWTTHAELERLCDFGAEELIAPRGWLRQHTNPLHPSLADLLSIAHESECPVDFLATRALRLHYWEGWLGWIETSPDGFTIERTYPRLNHADGEGWNIANPGDSVSQRLQQQSCVEATTLLVKGGDRFTCRLQYVSLADDKILGFSAAEPTPATDLWAM